MTIQLILDTEDEPDGPCCRVTIIMAAKTVDSYRFLHGVEKRMLKRWVSLPRETQIPWTPLATPLSKCTVSLVSSAGIALKTDQPFDPEIERRDPWFADPSYRVLTETVRTGDVQVCHLHINPAFAEEDLNTVLPVERLDQLAKLGEIGAVAPSHYSYMGYTLRPERLLRESLPGMVRQLREELVNMVVLVPV
jgi:D-proline reductase (dithiol) PrdB